MKKGDEQGRCSLATKGAGGARVGRGPASFGDVWPAGVGPGLFRGAEYLRFVRIAIASAAEVGNLPYFARELSYLDPQEYRRLDALRRDVTVLLIRLARSLDRPTTSTARSASPRDRAR